MANVVLNNLTKYYGNKLILDDINLEINDKEFVVLVGASGCGKSTLLKIISGLEKQSSGDIYIANQKVNKTAPKDRDIAMVFQNYALYPHLNVYENMAFPLKARRIAKCEIRRRVENASEILGLNGYLKSKPKELSGGQRQRVALGRAIVRDPQVFLMDEPLSNLDAKLRISMRSELKKLHQKLNATFIYVTHDQTEALTMGDKIVVLNEGKIQQIDSPKNIYNNPKNTFVASFMGTHPMNLLNATLDEGLLNFGNIFLNLAKTPINYPRNLKNIIVGIRAEDFVEKSNPNYPFNQIKFSAKVLFEELLGSDKIVHFKIANQTVQARLASNVNTSDEIYLSLDPMKIKFFDPVTKFAL